MGTDLYVTKSAEEECSYEYYKNDAGAIVITKYTGSDIEPAIDSSDNIVIEKDAFKDAPIEGLLISSEGSVTIADEAFTRHATLKGFIVNGSCVSFEPWCFECCKSLESIHVHGAISKVGREAFSLCDSLSLLKVYPEGKSYPNPIIEEGAFGFCTSLHIIDIPDNTTFIGERAFRCCHEIISIRIPSSVKTIGEFAFEREPCIICESGSYAARYAREYNLNLEITPSTGSEGNSASSSGGCYVATAIYGSYDCPEVWTLRRFRDLVLAESPLGRLFIRTYYTVSPSLVRHFGESRTFHALFKPLLDKKVNDLKSKGFSDKPYNDKLW